MWWVRTTSTPSPLWIIDPKYLKLSFGRISCFYILISTPSFAYSMYLHQIYYVVIVLICSPFSSQVNLHVSDCIQFSHRLNHQHNLINKKAYTKALPLGFLMISNQPWNFLKFQHQNQIRQKWCEYYVFQTGFLKTNFYPICNRFKMSDDLKIHNKMLVMEEKSPDCAPKIPS